MQITQQSINCKGKLLDLSSPVIMGILNVTPDSFFDGGRYQQEKSILQQVEKMLKDGATIIDIGGMSSRPGAEFVSIETELKRVIPIVEKIVQQFPEAIISIDTIRAKVAQEGIEAGGHIINDISTGQFDEDLLPTVAKLDVPYILMHMQGKPSTMQQAPTYNNVLLEVTDFFIQKIEALRTLGVKDIILDVGYGFGKTVEHNYQLLKYLSDFKIFDLPLLAGISRKSMICKVLKVNPPKALNGTTALHMVALQQGAKILRVHDVKEAKQVIQLWQQLEAVGY